MTSETSFARLVSLACHDLRTPLATVHGFARTLTNMGDLGDPAERYLGMIEAASLQMTELLDELGLVARIEAGRYEPALREVHTGELARVAAERLDSDQVRADGEGGAVTVDVEATERAISALARCALRHGGVDRVEIVAQGPELTIAPIAPAAAPVVLAEELRDLGAAAAHRLISALGGSITLTDETLTVRLPH